MTKNEIIKLYLSDLNNVVEDSAAQRNRVEMLKSELERSTETVNVDLDIVRLSSLLKKYQAADYNLSKDTRMSFEYPEQWSVKRSELNGKIALLEAMIKDEV